MGKKPLPNQQAFNFVEENDAARIAGVMVCCTGPACRHRDPQGILKPIEEFGKNKKGGQNKWCKECITEDKLRRKLGMKPMDFQKILSAQNGACAICHDVETKKSGEVLSLRVDYDNKKNIRGLLCSNCSMRLRQLEWTMDHMDWFRAAQAYLGKYDKDSNDSI